MVDDHIWTRRVRRPGRLLQDRHHQRRDRDQEFQQAENIELHATPMRALARWMVVLNTNSDLMV